MKDSKETVLQIVNPNKDIRDYLQPKDMALDSLRIQRHIVRVMITNGSARAHGLGYAPMFSYLSSAADWAAHDVLARRKASDNYYSNTSLVTVDKEFVYCSQSGIQVILYNLALE